jgi:hypothetical protein
MRLMVLIKCKIKIEMIKISLVKISIMARIKIINMREVVITEAATIRAMVSVIETIIIRTILCITRNSPSQSL